MKPAFDRALLVADATRAAEGAPVLVTGPPGSGKTTLLHALAEAHPALRQHA